MPSGAGGSRGPGAPAALPPLEPPGKRRSAAGRFGRRTGAPRSLLGGPQIGHAVDRLPGACDGADALPAGRSATGSGSDWSAFIRSADKVPDASKRPIHTPVMFVPSSDSSISSVSPSRSPASRTTAPVSRYWHSPCTPGSSVFGPRRTTTGRPPTVPS